MEPCLYLKPSRRSQRPEKSYPRFIAVLLFALAGLLPAANVFALGLGKMSVLSRLGSHFLAEVELLTGAEDGRFAAECFRLAQASDSSNGLPALTHGSLTVERRNGRLILLVRSLQPVNEPVLLVNLHAGCGAEVAREYTLLIDGPEADAIKPPVAASQVATPAARGDSPPRTNDRPAPMGDEYPERWQVKDGETVFSIANTLFPGQPKARARFLRALLKANPEIDPGDIGGQGAAPLMPGQVLQIPDTRRNPARPVVGEHSTPPASDVKASPSARRKKDANIPPVAVATDGMSDRLSLSGATSALEGEADEWSLRLSTELSYEKINTVSENQRSVLRLEYKLLAAIYEQANQQLDLAEQVRQLEASVAELKAATEQSLNSTATPLGVQSGPDKTTAKPAVSAKPAVAGPSSARRESSSSIWPWFIGLAALVGLLVWLLRRFAVRQPRDSLSEHSEATLPDETLLLSVPGLGQPPVVATGASVEKPQAAKPFAASAAGGSVSLASPESVKGSTVVVEHDDFDPVMELAEIMLAFGRVKGAIEALQEYINAHPDGAIQPWMKLIEIFGQNSMRAEYEELVPLFQAHFNVLPAEWIALPEVVSQLPLAGDEDKKTVSDLLLRTPNIAGVAMLREAIVQHWNAPEGAQVALVFLNKLLREKNNDTHQGLTLSMVGELLYLQAVLEKRLGALD